MEQDFDGPSSPHLRARDAIGYELPIGRRAWPKVVGAMLLVPLFGLGWVITRHSIDPGIDNFQNDRIAHAVAKEAYNMAWVHVDNPIQRLFLPAAKVVLVERRPGHCKAEDTSQDAASMNVRAASMNVRRDPGVSLRADPGVATTDPSWSEVREYVARVRFYTTFGIPAVAVNITCSGASYEPLP